MFEPIERHREDVVHAWSLARALHTQVGPSPVVGGVANFREKVETDGLLSRLPEAIRKALFVTAEHLPTAESTLLTVARSEPFRADFELARRTLDAIRSHSHPVRAAQMLSDGLRLPQISALRPDLRPVAVDVLTLAVTHAVTRKAFDTLIVDDGFAVSTDHEKRALLEYLIGPEQSAEIAPMRRNRLRLLWTSRVEGLLTLLSKEVYRQARPSLRREHLRDFLHARVRRVLFLDATARNGHALVVFGDPSDRRSLSYGRRWLLGRTKRPVVRTNAPDPSHHSGWTKPMSDASVRYHGQQAVLSRHRERQLISWIETSHTFHDDLRARGKLGKQRISGEPSSFIERALEACTGICAGLPVEMTSGVYLAGHLISSDRDSAHTANAADKETP